MTTPPLPPTFGRYRILEEIGRGEMGRVYRAHDPHTDRIVALKVLDVIGDKPPEQAEEARTRFLREARAAGRLAHPGIVAVYDADVDAASGAPFLAMELVAGRSLAALLEERGLLPWSEAVAIAAAVADALDHAHERGVVHRDLKPANVLLAAGGAVKVSDFGVAKLVDDSSTVSGAMRGTPSYMAPEQIRSETVDGRADLYSLGAVLYELLTGEPPFRATTVFGVAHQAVHDDPKSPSFACPDLPLEVERVVLRAMAKRPAERYASGREMAAALRGAAQPDALSTSDLAPMPVSVPTAPAPTPPSAPPPPAPAAPVADTRPASTPLPTPAPAPPRRSPTALAIATLTAVLAGALAAALWLGRANRGPESSASPPPTPLPVSAEAPAPQPVDAPAATAAPERDAQPVAPEPPADAARPTTAAKPASRPKPAAPAEEPAPATDPAAEALAPAADAAVETAVPPAAAETATIELHFVNRIKEGSLSIFIDGQLAWSTPLASPKNPLRRIGGEELIGTIEVPAGAHDVEVRVANATERIDAREVVSGELAAGETRLLRVVLVPLRSRLKVKWEP